MFIANVEMNTDQIRTLWDPDSGTMSDRRFGNVRDGIFDGFVHQACDVFYDRWERHVGPVSGEDINSDRIYKAPILKLDERSAVNLTATFELQFKDTDDGMSAKQNETMASTHEWGGTIYPRNAQLLIKPINEEDNVQQLLSEGIWVGEEHIQSFPKATRLGTLTAGLIPTKSPTRSCRTAKNPQKRTGTVGPSQPRRPSSGRSGSRRYSGRRSGVFSMFGYSMMKVPAKHFFKKTKDEVLSELPTRLDWIERGHKDKPWLEKPRRTNWDTTYNFFEIYEHAMGMV